MCQKKKKKAVLKTRHSIPVLTQPFSKGHLITPIYLGAFTKTKTTLENARENLV